jgi:hypothetical protein
MAQYDTNQCGIVRTATDLGIFFSDGKTVKRMSIARGMLEFMADVQKLQVMRFGAPEFVSI